MITNDLYTVHSLLFGGATEFFVSRGIETLTPAGFYAIQVVYGLSMLGATLLFLAAIFSNDIEDAGKYGAACLLTALGGAATLFALLYAELYVFQTWGWMFLLAVLASAQLTPCATASSPISGRLWGDYSVVLRLSAPQSRP